MGGSKSKAIKKHAKVAFTDSELEVLEVYFELLRCHDHMYYGSNLLETDF